MTLAVKNRCCDEVEAPNPDKSHNLGVGRITNSIPFGSLDNYTIIAPVSVSDPKP